MRRSSRRASWWLLAVLWVGVGGLTLWIIRNAPPEPAPTVREVKPKPPVPKRVASPTTPRVIVDSRMTRAQALRNNNFPSQILDKMDVVTVSYVGFDGRDHVGQIVVDQELASEVKQIFAELKAIRFPIKQVVPIVHFNWNDLRSIRANNTSGFNYRRQETPNGTSRVLSKHAIGRAIDLNPWLNPYVSKNGKSISKYDPSVAGTLSKDSGATKIFLTRGWKWGGNWAGSKDYQHFEKP